MAIKWVCTGKSEHAYQYNDGEGGIATNTVITIDFTAEIDDTDEAGSLNELYETKPILTQSGVEAFVGLIPYAQGFTITADTRLTDEKADSVIAFETIIDNDKVTTPLEMTVGELIHEVNVGNVITLSEDDGGDEPLS